MNVLHLPTQVGGNSWGLAQAENQIGMHSRVLYKCENWLSYPGDIILPYSKVKIIELFILLKEFYNIVGKYDVYHFNFGSTLIDCPMFGLDLFDLPFYKKKNIFVTYNGSDARQREIEDKEFMQLSGEKQDVLYSNSKEREWKKKRINKFKKYGARFFALNPDLMKYLPDTTIFLPYTIPQWYDIEEYPKKKGPKEKLTIVHAPTNRNIKGTELIIKAIENLKKEYINKIEFILVEGLSHFDALKRYVKADIIIDQLRIGWYGAFAVEAMKMRRPVVAFINEADLI